MSLIIIIITIVLLGSALFSGIEVALFSVPMGKAMALVKQKKSGAKSLLEVKKRISRPITVIVIFNNIVNISGSILVGVTVSRILGDSWLGIISALFIFLVIIFGEIIPKSIGENHAEKIGLIVAKPILMATKIFTPIVWLFEKITNKFSSKKITISEDEIKILSHIGRVEGTIERDEQEIIQNVFRMNDLCARDIMTPRSVMIAFEYNKTLFELKDKIYNSSHSRVPIFEKDDNNIIGICFIKELLIALAKNEINRKVFEFKHNAITVSDKTKVDYLLILFQRRKSHLAIVKDKFGTVLGVITLEDVLEQLVGEIVDETDEATDLRAEAKKKLAT
ncbi:MAG: hemolysin family protein [Patescibacteria group bacterium]|nr:hemolysin family protein [Patescibacteria group bacterium]